MRFSWPGLLQAADGRRKALSEDDARALTDDGAAATYMAKYLMKISMLALLASVPMSESVSYDDRIDKAWKCWSAGMLTFWITAPESKSSSSSAARQSVNAACSMES